MKTLVGKVVSDKMQKSAVVSVERWLTHPKYHKRFRRTQKFVVANEMGAKMGDKVEMQEIRPMSKLKHFKVSKIVK